MSSYISKTAYVSPNAYLENNVSIWHHSQILENCTIGENTRIGSNVYIDGHVKVGKNCKIQNNAQIYDPAELQNGVFIGPNVILTNDKHPRAINQFHELKLSHEWNKTGVLVEIGASIGAGSICVGPISIGKWALIGAGSVVVKNVPQFSLIVGNPGVQIGWVGTFGMKLDKVKNNLYVCPASKELYSLENGVLNQLEYEDNPRYPLEN